jgi:hypothetical protein
MHIPAAQIQEAWALIEDAHPDCTIAILTNMWKHVTHEGATPHYRIGCNVSIFEPWSSVGDSGRTPDCEVMTFDDAGSLLQWAKDGATIEEVADA